MFLIGFYDDYSFALSCHLVLVVYDSVKSFAFQKVLEGDLFTMRNASYYAALAIFYTFAQQMVSRTRAESSPHHHSFSCPSRYYHTNK